MDVFFSLGLGGMFIAAFLAATILPLSSEVVLGLLLAGGYDPPAVVAVATAGNVLGALVNYWIGLAGTGWLAARISRVSEADIQRARERFQSWGSIGLLLAVREWEFAAFEPLSRHQKNN